MKRLIVNADDFGLATEINDAIIVAHRSGIVTSTTIMSNMPAFADAIEKAKAIPDLGVGAHLNLTWGEPVSTPGNVSSLLENDGRFCGSAAALYRGILSGQVDSKEIEHELCAQIDKCLQAGITPTHVDTHAYIGELPPIRRAVLRAMRRFGIRRMRNSHERVLGTTAWDMLLDPVMMRRCAFRAILSSLAWWQKGAMHDSGIVTPDYFCGLLYPGMWTRRILNNIMEELRNGVTEICCHPGPDDRAVASKKASRGINRSCDLRAFTDPGMVQLIKACDIRLINFRDI